MKQNNFFRLPRVFLFSLILFLSFTTQSKATDLGIGDIFYTMVNTDGDDNFSFVLLKDITASTTIYFTDNGWDPNTNNFIPVAEGTLTWTFTGNLSAGTEITILKSRFSTVTVSHGTITRTGSFSLSGTGDVIIAYRGSLGSPSQFIAAFNTRGNGWPANPSNSGVESGLPTGLTNGTNALGTTLHKDDWRYKCSSGSIGDVATLRSLLADQSKWEQGESVYTSPNCGITVGAVNTAPTVTTTAASSILDTSATLAGNVTADGGATITERGIVYSVTATNPNPLIAGTGVTKNTNGAATGVFSESIPGLTADTSYSYKAYAINSEGTSYGAVQTFTTQKTNQTITFGALAGKTYGDAPFALTGSASSGLTVTYVSSNTAVATISGTTVTIIGAGSTNITASQAGNVSYSAAPNVVQALTVGKATLTATADNNAKTYGDINPAFTISYSGFKNSETSAVLTAIPTGSSIATTTTNVGTVDIDLAGGLDNNYDFIYVKGTLTIAKATLTATADNKAKTYGDANPAFTNSYSGFKNSETSAVLTVEPFASSVATTTTNAGNVDINVAGGLDNNYNFLYVKGTLTIGKATITATADNKTKAYGDANPAFTLFFSGFKNSETSAVLTIEPTGSSIASATTNVGNIDIDVAGGLDNNYDFLYVKGTLTIGKATLTATADNKAKVYGDLNPAFTITYSGFKNSETSAVLTVPPTASSIATTTTNVGNVDIDVAGGLDNNYNFIYVKGTLTIGKATLTATADNKSKTYGDANPAFTITYSGFKNSETSAVLTVEPFASTIAIATTTVGTAAINVAGGLDNNYNFVYVTGTLTIGKATLTVTADNKSKIYGDANPAFTVSYSGFKNSETSAILTTEPTGSSSASATTNVGTVDIDVAGGLDDNYDFLYTKGTLTIGKATLTATADNKAKAYGDANPAFTISYSGFKNAETSAVLLIEPTVSSIATTTSNVGNVDIDVAGGLDNNYNFIHVKGTLTIGKTTLTVSADNKAKTYGNANPAFTISYSGFKNSDTSAVLTTEPTASSIATTATNAGTAAITVAGGLDNNYNLVYVTGTLTIGKAPLTVTADNKAKTYGDANPAFTVSYSGFKNSDTSAVLTSAPTGSSSATTTTNVGIVDIDVAGGLDDNYNFIYVKGTLTIGKATLTATAENKTKTYGATNPAFTISYSGFKNSETSAVLTTEPTGSSSATTTTNVGTVDIDVAGGLDDNYNFIYVKGTLTIGKSILTVTADNKTKTYGDANPAFTISYSGFKNSETSAVLTTEPTGSSIATTATNAGTAAINVAGGLDNNYDFVYVNGTLTIGKALLIVAAYDATKVYGDENPAFWFNYLSSSFKNGDTYTALSTYPQTNSTATKTSNVGTEIITVSGGEADNYDFSYTSAILTITQAPLTATADDKSREYGDANPAFTVSYVGFKNSETASVLDAAPTASSTATNTTDVGTATITLSAGTDNNYTITSNNGTLTIDKAILIVTAQNTTVEYGENFSIDFEYGPFKNGEDASVLDNGAYVYIPVDYTNAGTYTIIPDAMSDNNYTPSYVNGTLTKTKATVNVMATANSRMYGDANPTLAFTYGAFKNSETADVIDTPPTASTTATTTTNVGTAIITVSGGLDNNYNFNYTSADLTINKATLTATADDKTKTFGQENPDFTITYSGFKNSETAIVLDTEPITSSTATNTTPVGVSTISLTGGIDDNYTIINVNGTLTIVADVDITINDIIQKKKYGFSPNGDGINDTWTIENIDIFANNTVKVFNKSGTKVYEQKAYNNTWNGVSKTTGDKLPVGPYLFVIELNEAGKKPVTGWLYINY